MKKIKVSIIIPVYNTEKYIPKCLDSVINQSLKNIEIICINDGSTDNSLKILNKYAEKDSRIKIISKKNEGQAIARNIGINEANGEYIGFIDSDDFIKKDMYEKLYNHSKKNKLDIAMCKVSTIDNKTNNINDNLWYYSLGVFRDFKKEIFNHNDTKEFTCEISVTPYNKIYKKSLLDQNNILFPEGLIFEDEVFFYDVYLKAKKVSVLNENLYYYRTEREGSTVEKTFNKDYSDIVPIFKLIREKFIETGNYEEYKILLANRFIHLELWRFSQTGEKFKENFYKILKVDLKELLCDIEIKNNLNSNIKSRTFKILKSKNCEDFRKLDQIKEFSIVMACYNTEKYIHESIESLITQNFGFESNIQLILVDDGSTDKTGQICRDYAQKYPDNIIYIHQKNQGQGIARNNGLKYVKGKYVNFLDSDDKLKPDTLTYIYDFFEKHFDEIDLISTKIIFFDRQTGNHPLNYKYEKNEIINLKKDFDYPQLSASSSFFKKEVFDTYKFGTKIISSEDSLMINKILIDKMKYGVIKEGSYLYRKRSSDLSTIDSSQKKKEFFIERMKFYFKELIDYSIYKIGHVPYFIQYTLVYDLQWIFKINNIDKILNKNETEEFFRVLKDVLNNIDDDIILKLKNDKNNIRKHMLAFKYGNIHTIIENDDAFVYADNIIIDTLSDHKIYLDIIEIKQNTLFISGFLTSFFDNTKLDIEAIKEIKNKKEIFIGTQVHYTNREKKFLGQTIESPLNFDIKIPLNEKESTKVKIVAKYSLKNNTTFNELDLIFQNHARLSEKSNYSINKNHFLKFKNNEFTIKHYSYAKMIISEIGILKEIFKNKEAYYTSALFFRLIYLILFPFMRNKRIWLFMDRPNHADDNAEHLFKYAQTKKDNVKKYFAISSNSKDYDRIKKIGNILPFYSMKHYLIFLFSEKIISSHPDENLLNPFLGKNVQLYSGLINCDKIFLQHGITKDNISNWLHKYDKNLALLVTASQQEHDSFFNYDYNYDENVVQILGFPRFDNLDQSLTKKQIIIMPSWREELYNKNDEQIKKSEYFKKINSLINNKELINIARKKDYEIIFKPHPLVFKFIDLFDKNKYVKIDNNTNYQDIFNKSALMITDYSSVAFDFAYIKKPIIYYQYGDDYNFDNGYFDYKTMGFGEVLKTEQEIINSVNNYLNNKCKMNKKYIDRLNSFYKYKDKNNSKRVYEAIYKIIN